MLRKFISTLCLSATLIVSLTAQDKVRKAKITTNLGEITIKLHNDTPNHRDNFIKFVENGWFDGTLFHRVLPFFMAQGGDPNSVGAKPDQKLGVDRCDKLENEIKRHYFHKKGTLAAARLPDSVNPTKQSSACQFFLVQGFRQTDAQLDAMETENFKFSDIARAYYKTVGGSPHLDMNYTIFGEVIEGIEVLDLICAMRTGANVENRPNTDVIMHSVKMIN